MNKGELLDVLVQQGEFKPKSEAEKALGAVIGGIVAGLRRDRKVQLVGFGTFNVREMPEREGINPATRQPMRIPARSAGRCKPGQKLKDAV